MSELLVQPVEPGDAGLDTDSSPADPPPGTAPVHENFVVHRPGIMAMRGPIVNHTALDIGTTEIIGGIWAFNNRALVSTVAKSASATREPWTAPFRKAAAAADLALPNGTMKLVDFDAMTVSNVAGGANTAIGGRGARIGAYTYGLSYGVVSGTYPAVLENGGYLWRRHILRWDGTTTVPTLYTNAPEGGQDVRAHLNRLFVLGGRDVPSFGGAATTIEQSTLYFSDQGGPLTDVAASWQDDVSALTNKIVIDTDDSDFGVALAKVGENLVIFKRRSVHVLYGYSSSTFNVRTITSDIGCMDRRTVIEYEDGCYFLSDQGYMFFDGSTLTNTSENLRTSLNVAAGLTVGDAGVDGGRASAVKLSNDYVLLSICKQTFSTGVQATDTSRFAALLHTPTGRWSRFSSGATAVATPVSLARTSVSPFLIDGNRAVRIDKITSSEQATEATRGFDEVNSVKAYIPAKWYSAIYPLGSFSRRGYALPPRYSQLHRLMLDYSFIVDNAADDASDGWYVSLVSGTGVVLTTEYQVPAMGDPSGYTFRRRSVVDTYSEASDCQLRVEWKPGGTPPALVKAEIYGGQVEFQAGRQRRSA